MVNDRALLENVGRALFGDRWQTYLGLTLEVSDRTVRRWAAGDAPVPEEVWPALVAVIRQRRLILDRTLHALAARIQKKG
jgi:hypothetical protein